MYENMETSFIENATMTRRLYADSTEVMKYRIYPNEGYVLHDTQYDQPVYDEETGEETGEIKKGYIPYPSFVSCSGRYDFAVNEREFYCVPTDTVPENQIFSNGGNHEVM
jgi:hypothetical protein